MQSNSEEQYEIEEIIGKKVDKQGKVYYLIKWKGYQTHESTWESISFLDRISHLIKDFDRKIQGKQLPYVLEDFLKPQLKCVQSEEQRIIKRKQKVEKIDEKNRIKQAKPRSPSKSQKQPKRIYFNQKRMWESHQNFQCNEELFQNNKQNSEAETQQEAKSQNIRKRYQQSQNKHFFLKTLSDQQYKDLVTFQNPIV